MGRPFISYSNENDIDKKEEDDIAIPFNSAFLSTQLPLIENRLRRRARIVPYFDAQSTFRTHASVLEYTSRVQQNSSFALLFNLEFVGMNDISTTMRLLKNLNPGLEDIFILELMDYWEEHYEELYALFVSSSRSS